MMPSLYILTGIVSRRSAKSRFWAVESPIVSQETICLVVPSTMAGSSLAEPKSPLLRSGAFRKKAFKPETKSPVSLVGAMGLEVCIFTKRCELVKLGGLTYRPQACGSDHLRAWYRGTILSLIKVLNGQMRRKSNKRRAIPPISRLGNSRLNSGSEQPLAWTKRTRT